jgi:molybdopterin synthase catalytic subunit
LVDIVNQAKLRWDLMGVRVIHRIGLLNPTDQIVFVGTASTHRQAAFAACEFIMDYLKTQAPFWKKETINGQTRWVDAKESDNQALTKWK